MESVTMELTLRNSVGSSDLQVEIDWVPPKGNARMSAVLKDLAWLEDNICTIVGVAGGMATILILTIQVTMICRHRRHGCKSFQSPKIEVKM